MKITAEDIRNLGFGIGLLGGIPLYISLFGEIGFIGIIVVSLLGGAIGHFIGSVLGFTDEEDASTDQRIDDSGDISIIMASEQGALDVLEHLLFLKVGGSVDERTTYGETALMLAAANGHRDCVRALISADASVDIAANNNQTALHFAVLHEKAGVVSDLLEAGADVNAQSINGTTALIGAVETGNDRIARYLIEAGADRTIKNNDGLTALDIARSLNDTSVVETLIQHTPEIDEQSKLSQSIKHKKVNASFNDKEIEGDEVDASLDLESNEDIRTYRANTRDIYLNTVVTKKCPMCAEDIRLEARKCRFCGTEFTEEEVNKAIEELEQKRQLEELEKQRKDEELKKRREEKNRLRELSDLIEQKDRERMDMESEYKEYKKSRTIFFYLIFLTPLGSLLLGSILPMAILSIGIFISPLLFIFLVILFGKKAKRANRAMMHAINEIAALVEKTSKPVIEQQVEILSPDQQTSEQKRLISGIRDGDWVTVNKLLKNGVSPIEIRDEEGYSPIDLARKRNDTPMINLLKSYIEVTSPNKDDDEVWSAKKQVEYEKALKKAREYFERKFRK